MTTLASIRVVIDAKHRANHEKPESERVERLTRREWIKSVRDTQIPEPQMDKADIRWLGSLMFKQGKEDHDHLS